MTEHDVTANSVSFDRSISVDHIRLCLPVYVFSGHANYSDDGNSKVAASISYGNVFKGCYIFNRQSAKE